MARYKAEFDGVSKIRSSSVVLTHAWGCMTPDGWYIGFSTSENHARRSIEQFCSKSKETKISPAIEIDDAADPKKRSIGEVERGGRVLTQ